jgi:hypothetical protein
MMAMTTMATATMEILMAALTTTTMLGKEAFDNLVKRRND